MYSELDIHVESVCDQLMECFIKAAAEIGSEPPEIEEVRGAEHPTSWITVTSHDGRRFRIIMTTAEIP